MRIPCMICGQRFELSGSRLMHLQATRKRAVCENCESPNACRRIEVHGQPCCRTHCASCRPPSAGLPPSGVCRVFSSLPPRRCGYCDRPVAVGVPHRTHSGRSCPGDVRPPCGVVMARGCCTKPLSHAGIHDSEWVLS